jgi:hypothetical protein
MTVDKREQITLPVWVISGLVSIVLAGFTTWGVISAKAATLEVRASHNEINIETLRSEKADRNEFTIFREQLNTIQRGIESVNTKLDTHIKDSK